MPSYTGTLSTVPDVFSSKSISKNNENLEINNPMMTDKNVDRLHTEKRNNIEVDIGNKTNDMNKNTNRNDSITNIEQTNSGGMFNDSDETKKPQFECKTRSIQLLHQLISSVQLFGNFCILDISSEGICFTINEGNVCKVRLNLSKKIFQTYQFNGVWREKTNYTETELYADDTDLSDNDDENYVTNRFDQSSVISININISSFLETINIHVKDKNTSDNSIECTFRYERDGDPFIMIFEDDCIIERCEISTYYIENEKNKNKKRKRKNGQRGKHNPNDNDNYDSNSERYIEKEFNIDNYVFDDSIFRLDSSKILFDIIIKSNILHDIIKDMNDLNTDRFILYCNKMDTGSEKDRRSKIMFITKSRSDSIGFSKLIIPQRKSNIPLFELFKPIVSEESPDKYTFSDCYNLSLSSTYHFDYFAKLLKAIKLSKLIKIRKDMNGITSLLLLLGKNFDDQNEPLEHNGLYGSSIEFITLESISIDELSAMNAEVAEPSLLSKLGYSNQFVEQLIKDDQDIQTIRVGDNGQLITLDDYFGNPGAEFEQIEGENLRNLEFNDDNINNDYMPIEEMHNRKTDEINRDNNILQLTEQLTMSLLGHATPILHLDESNIQIEQTIIENGSDEDQNSKRRHVSNKPKLQNNKKGKVGKSTKNKKQSKNSSNKKENDGIETVGGAIEIPLFI